jgi:hypothetical protein
MTVRNTSFTCRRTWLAFILLGLLLHGCTAATQRLHPQFPQYRHTMGKLLVMQPDIGIYEKMPDGSRLYDQANSRRARRQVQQAIVNQLRNRHFSVLAVTPDDMQTADVRDVAALFRSVNRSIQLHTIGPQVFPDKKADFEYHLGSVAPLLDAYQADGLVIAIGHQTGIEQPTKNWLSIAVAEPGGAIVWYGIQGDHERFNIHEKKSMQTLVASAMASFWEHGS